MAKKKISLEVVNPNAAGIDIGSRSHWVSVGQDSQSVKEFGVYSDDSLELCKWLFILIEKYTSISLQKYTILIK